MPEFKIGNALIDAIYRYVNKWRATDMREPKDHLRIYMSHDAMRAILSLPYIDIISFVEMHYMSSGPIKGIIGIPVEASDDVVIMEIKQV